MLGRQTRGLEKSIRQRRRWAKLIYGLAEWEWNGTMTSCSSISAVLLWSRRLLHWLQARQLFLHARNAAHHHLNVSGIEVFPVRPTNHLCVWCYQAPRLITPSRDHLTEQGGDAIHFQTLLHVCIETKCSGCETSANRPWTRCSIGRKHGTIFVFDSAFFWQFGRDKKHHGCDQPSQVGRQGPEARAARN